MSVIESALSGRIPDAALEYCIQLWQEQPFRFKLARNRASKLGDFRFDPRTKVHQVTVNSNLNPYQFLITYVHEVAHSRVHDPKRRLKPHGSHWKNEFKSLLLPLMNDQVFPDDILRPLARHMKNPKASTASDPVLFQSISKYDVNNSSTRIIDLNIGDVFQLRGRSFSLIEKKRTRALCLDLTNQKRYLISMIAEVSVIQHV